MRGNWKRADEKCRGRIERNKVYSVRVYVYAASKKRESCMYIHTAYVYIRGEMQSETDAEKVATRGSATLHTEIGPKS